MTDPQNTNPPDGSNTPVQKAGDHDRVAMLSLRADGTPDQLNPEFVVDKDTALAATALQFKQQAVSAADVEARYDADRDRGTTVADAPQDPTVVDLTKTHEKAEKAAESAAKSAVNDLTK